MANDPRFLDWKVYRDSRDLFSMILRIVKELPKEYRFELGGQVVRSALSVPLNIAEGSGKSSDAELNRFFNIALGSLNETLAVIDIIYYNKPINKKDFDATNEMIACISKQLGGFKKKLHG